MVKTKPTKHRNSLTLFLYQLEVEWELRVITMVKTGNLNALELTEIRLVKRWVKEN